MTDLQIAPARSSADLEEALAVAYRIFSPQSAIARYSEYKCALWKEDPAHKIRNLMLARAEGRVVGLVRIVPRNLYRADQKFVVAGISSVCLIPEFRGKGISELLVREALDYACAAGFDIALLFARRAADYYYTRFGFCGVSSYNRITISLTSSSGETQPELTLRPASREHIGVYANAYLACYQNTFGYFERLPAYWNFLFKKVEGMPDLRWFTIALGSAPIGYAVDMSGTIQELAWIRELPIQVLANSLSAQLGQPAIGRTLTVVASPQHRLFSNTEAMDISVAFRECSFGGHMVKILNASRVCELLAARVASTLDRLGSKRYSEDRDGIAVTCDDQGCRVSLPGAAALAPSYAQTSRLLGASALSLQHWRIDPPQPFNVSILDQF